MANIRFPRKGSMQYWPRKRAKRIYARVRYRNISGLKEAKPVEFAGYKVGMIHGVVLDNTPTSMTKNEEKVIPLTIIECPPLKIASVRFYKNSSNGLFVADEVFVGKDKHLFRKIPKNKKEKSLEEFEKNLNAYADITAIVYTLPHLSGLKKKTPELFEIKLSGSNQEKFNYLKEKINKEINIEDVFSEGELVDIHAITKGKGFQGAVKRFGIALTQHKSQKGQRTPGSLGPWNAQVHIQYRVAHAGQLGFHQRTEYNKLLVKISPANEFKKESGFENYGQVKSKVLLVKGSVPGSKKRLIRIIKATRANKKRMEQLNLLKLVM
ncbi:MAG: 50S ribosomal protein L3 [Candidatus Woesearchaeota archaeon]